MCLTTESKRCTVANKPIPCYKVVWKEPSGDNEPRRFTSEFFNFVYETGKEYKLKPTDGFIAERPGQMPGQMRFLYLNIGFHSYGRLKDATDNCNNYDGSRGCRGLVILRCEIPAGARYWRGNKSCIDDNYIEYCSDRIRVTGWRLRGETKWRT